MSFFDFLNNSFLIMWVPILCSVGVLLISILKYRHTKQISIGKMRFEQIIQPIFEVVETYMQRKAELLPVEDINLIISYIEYGMPYAGGKFISFKLRLKEYYNLNDNEKEKLLRKFCLYINKEYDNLSKTLGVPCRPFLYRYFNYKIHYILPTFRYIVLFVLRLLLIFCILTCIYSVVILILYQFFPNSIIPAIKLLILSAFAILILIFLIYCYETDV